MKIQIRHINHHTQTDTHTQSYYLVGRGRPLNKRHRAGLIIYIAAPIYFIANCALKVA